MIKNAFSHSVSQNFEVGEIRRAHGAPHGVRVLAVLSREVVAGLQRGRREEPLRPARFFVNFFLSAAVKVARFTLSCDLFAVGVGK